MKVMGVPPVGGQEYMVLQAVWRLGRCTVRQVFEAEGEPQGLAYTTIATVLDRLHDKGLLARQRDGKTLVYKAAKKRGTQKALAKTLLGRLLGPDPVPAVATLVDAVEDMDPDLLDHLAEEVEKRRARRGS